MDKIDLKWNIIAPLDEDSINALESGIQGVYRLSARHSDTSIYVFYVGNDIDIKAKLLSHLNGTDNNACITNQTKLNICFFKYAKVENNIERDLAFKQLCKIYHPSCNSIQEFITEDVAIINLN